MLAAVSDNQVAELVDHPSGLLAHLARNPPARAGVDGPVLVERWTDGDLLPGFHRRRDRGAPTIARR